MADISNRWMWVGFCIFVVIALSIDTFVSEKKPSASPNASIRASLCWTGIWIVCALLFNALLWVVLYTAESSLVANQKALDFFAGYLIEKSLSIDNLFAFYLIFHQFHIPKKYQHRVLVYGVWSAVLLRLIIILFGTYLINRFHWIIYLLGLFLVVTGVKMFFVQQEKDLSQSRVFTWMKKNLRLHAELHENHFFVKENHTFYITRLLVALVFVEISDVIFAFDSIPAIFSITRDPFIVWTSNIFAILGLRSLYFLLAGMAERFVLLKHGIAVVLIFVGFKMLIEPWLIIPTLYSLMVITLILAAFIRLSLKYRAPSQG
ncbi:MAG: TerC/Alx family metal homeostasis membrane protein [Gammaproteobacteria bacterium]|nr:TerC/Alx family metal homeostasis membrane protein [Gammaproteobacteria bacterium]